MMKQIPKASFWLCFLVFSSLLILNNACKKDKNVLDDPEDGPLVGYADGNYTVPTEAGLESIAQPTTVVGDGTASSCTGQAFIDAVAVAV